MVGLHCLDLFLDKFPWQARLRHFVVAAGMAMSLTPLLSAQAAGNFAILTAPLICSNAFATNYAAAVFGAYNFAVGQTGNFGVDTDGDGLADVVDPFPNDVSGSNEFEFYDNMDLSNMPSTGFGFSAVNYHEAIPATTPEANRHQFPLCWDRINRNLTYVSVAEQAGATPQDPVSFVDPILYRVPLGGAGSETQLTTSGQLGAIYEFNGGSPSGDDTRVVLHVNEDGEYFAGGKLVEVLDNGTVIDFFKPADGRRFLDPHIVKYYGDSDVGGLNGDFLITTVIRPNNPINLKDSYLAAFPIVGRVPDLNAEIIVADLGTLIRWPSVREDGRRLGVTSFFINVPSGNYTDSIPMDAGEFHNRVLGISSPYTSMNAISSGRGSMFNGYIGLNKLISEDIWEQKFDWADVDFSNTNFDIGIDSGVLSRVGFIKNQFLPKPNSDGIIVYSSDVDGDGFMEIYISSLRSRVIHWHPSGHIPNDLDLIWRDATGGENIGIESV